MTNSSPAKEQVAADVAQETEVVRRPVARHRTLARLRRNTGIVIGLTILGLMLVISIIHPVLPLPDPLAVGVDILQPPSAEHLMGTDEVGRDLFARILSATPGVLLTVAGSVGAASLVGLAIGLVAGYFGGWFDLVSGRVVEMLLAFPAVFIAIAVVVVMGPGHYALLVAITIAEFPVFARLARASTISTRARDHVASAVAIGASPLRVIMRHVVPFTLAPIAVQVAIAARTAVVLSASLNFLGLGLQPPAPSWGNMIANAQQYLYTSVTYAIFPAIAIVLLVLGFNLLADGLHELVDPRAAIRPVRGRRQSSQVLAENRDAQPSPNEPEPLLEVRDLRVRFHGRGSTVHAVDGISYTLRPGEVISIVGESGSGKSVSAMSLLGLIDSDSAEISGSIRFNGEELLAKDHQEMETIRGRSIAMIFQDPMTSLNPVLTVGHQIVEQVRRHMGLSEQAARRRAIDLLTRVGIPAPESRLNEYPHQFSGGMRQRVMIAMALSCDPKVLIADEPTTALDVTIQAQILDILRELRDELDLAVIFITHDLGVVAGLADRVLVMYAGRILEMGPVRKVFHESGHPYTRALLDSVPRVDAPRRGKQFVIPGSPPDMRDPPPGCAFWARCPFRLDPRCERERPELREVATEHAVASFCDLPK